MENLKLHRPTAADHRHEHPTIRVRAVWNGTVLADSDTTILVEGNHYFPPADVWPENLVPSGKRSNCPWKGEARYWDVVVDGERNPGAAWYYPDPSPAAAEIRGYIAFWEGVRIEPVPVDSVA